MNEILILNSHHVKQEAGTWFFHRRRIYIGRGSPLGNPYKITATCSRDQAIAQYEDWLYGQLERENSHATWEMTRLAGLVADSSGQPLELVCYCAPKPCHGDIIKRIILQALGQQS